MRANCRPTRRQSPRAGFTLIEILIVVVILSLIASIVLPQFSNATNLARASMLADNLRMMRSQIALFKHNHLGVNPGYPDGDTTAAPTNAAFSDHMTKGTNINCEVGSAQSDDYPLGPYFSQMPTNPFNERLTVQIVGDAQAFPSEGDGSHGYIYQPFTGIIKADTADEDEEGISYFDY